MFDRYEKYLSSDMVDGFWSEIGVDEAADILGNFQKYDWENLERQLMSKDPLWKRRCCESLGCGSPVYEYPILKMLMFDKDREVAIAAADSMRFIVGVDPKSYCSTDLMLAIDQLRKVADNVDHMVLDSLEKICLQQVVA